MNLNLARIKLIEKEYQLSSRYDRGPLNSVIIFCKRHNISERYDFGTRKHVESDLICLLRRDHKCYVFMFYVSLELASVFFCWQDSEKTYVCFLSFLCFFLHRQSLRIDQSALKSLLWHTISQQVFEVFPSWNCFFMRLNTSQ